jgi:hypothetical protein
MAQKLGVSAIRTFLCVDCNASVFVLRSQFKTDIETASRNCILKQHLGIVDRSAFHNVKTKHSSYGFEFDVWIYLEGPAQAIHRVISEQGFAPRPTRVSPDDPRVNLTFPDAPPPPSLQDGRFFERQRQGGGIRDWAAVSSNGMQLWFRALRY